MKKYISFFGLLLFIIILFNIDIYRLLNILSYSNIYYLIFAFLLNLPMQIIKSIRWNLILKNQNFKFTFIETFLIYSASTYFGVITPGRVGDFLKVIYLKNIKGIEISKGFPSVLIDRIFDFYLLIIFGSIGIIKFDIDRNFFQFFNFILIAMMLFPLLALNKKIIRFVMYWIFKFTLAQKIKSKVSNSFNVFHSEINKIINLNLIITGAFTMIGNLIIFLQYYLIVKGLNINLDFINIILFMTITSLVSLIPISIGGIGTRDGILIYLFSLFNLGAEKAVSLSILIFVIIYIGVGVLGFISWIMFPFKKTTNFEKLLSNK